jgi:hypothetical protein
MIVGAMALAYLKVVATGEPLKLLPGMMRLSVIELIRSFVPIRTGESEDLWQERAKMFERRIWRPSRPVLHLAAAYQYETRVRAGNAEAAAVWLGDEGSLRAVIARARLFANFMRQLPVFARAAPLLITVEL